MAIDGCSHSRFCIVVSLRCKGAYINFSFFSVNSRHMFFHHWTTGKKVTHRKVTLKKKVSRKRAHVHVLGALEKCDRTCELIVHIRVCVNIHWNNGFHCYNCPKMYATALLKQALVHIKGRCDFSIVSGILHRLASIAELNVNPRSTPKFISWPKWAENILKIAVFRAQLKWC